MNTDNHHDDRLHDLIAEYLRRIDAGEEVDRAAFIARQPDFAGPLAAYFDNADAVEALAGPRIGVLVPNATFELPNEGPARHDEGLQGTIGGAQDPTGGHLQKPFAGGSPQIAESFGRYKILKELGQGAMGAVYLAHDSQLDRRVALKIPKFSPAERQALLDRFYREARAAATLRHPNVCPVYDVGQIDGQHYITMAFIEGRPLTDFVRSKKQQPEKQVAAIVRKLALGLADAHAHGVIHRDLKPANVMIDGRGEPVVMDFGLARRTEHEEERMTRDGAVLGTPAYMSPEQVAGDQEQIGPAADIYSLGVILYELLTRQVPFGGTMMSILVQIATAEPKRPSELRPGLDGRLEAICLRMMAKRSSERFGSMDEVAQALAEFLKSPGKGPPEGQSGVKLHVARRLDDELPNSALETPGSLTIVPNVVSSPVSRAVAPGESFAQVKGPGENLSVAAQLRARRQRVSPTTWVATGAAAIAAIIILGAVTFFLRFGEVDVKVVIDDESLAVRFDEKTITFEGAGQAIRLRPGERKFIVERDGLEVETDSLAVKKDGKNILHVSLVDGRVVVAKDGKAPPTPTRSASEERGKRNTREGNGWHGWPKNAPPPAIAPFDATQAKEHQEAWAKYLNVPVEYTNSIGMKFVLIPPGEFTMGSTPAEIEAALKVVDPGDKHWQECIKSEAPRHKAILTQPIYLGMHEVTQGQYVQVLGKNPSYFSKTSPDKHYVEKVEGLDTAHHPVEGVSWNDAAEFCAKLSALEKLKPFYFRAGESVTPLDGAGYRLPIEAEWEFACRAGTTTRFWIGEKDADLVRAGWFNANAGGRTHAVGELKANPLGLYDIHGNVWEWVQDGWQPTYYEQFQEQPALDPQGPDSAGSRRMIRGGYWYNDAAYCRASNRRALDPSSRGDNFGFRAALVVDAVKAAIAASKSPSTKGPTASQGWPKDAANEIVDLLKLVDANRDAVHGKWTLTEAGLASDPSVPFCRLKLPYSPPPEYDFRVEFTAQAGNDILQLLAADGRSFTWLMGAWGGKYDGFDTVKDHPIRRNGVNIIGGPSAVRRGQRHTSLVQVRRDSVSALIDGKLVVRHATDGADLGMPREWSIGDGALGLGTTHDAVVFHKVELVAPAKFDKRGTWQGWPNDAPPPAIAPFDATQAKEHQEAWAAYLKLPVEYTNSIGMKFRLIPPGEFMMGSTPDEVAAAVKRIPATWGEQWRTYIKSEAPQHKVILTQPVYLGSHEVTQQQYEQVTGKKPSHFAPTGRGTQAVTGLGTATFPVESVNWNDAAGFCAKLSQQEKLKPQSASASDAEALIAGTSYRLPSEALWEFACRGGTTTLFCNGDKYEELRQVATYWPSGGRTHAVGELNPNPFGLYDMHGNVWEWVNDRWEADYYAQFRDLAAVDPAGPPATSGSLGIIRGGTQALAPVLCRSSHRTASAVGERFHDRGFRVALSVDAVRAQIASRSVEPDREVNGTVFPALSGAVVYAIQQKDEYKPLRDELARLAKSSKQDYRVVILPTLGDYLPRPADYLRRLVEDWQAQAARNKLPLHADRLVVILLAVNDKQLQIHFGPALKDGLGLDGPPVTNELLVPHFLPFAKQGKMSEGAVSLLRGVEKWITEHEKPDKES